MELLRKFKSHMALAFLLTLVILDRFSTALDNTTSTDSSPTHLSWTSNHTRYDFVFDTETPIRSIVKLNTDANNLLTNSLAKCTNSSACLFRNGIFLESFHLNNSNTHLSKFAPHVNSTQLINGQKTECDTGNTFKIIHYCSTHWNPPIYLSRVNCNHVVEWHSPIKCHTNSTNHERPCYIYDPSGGLIDLTPWILSNGSSYEINATAFNINDFHFNVCNEAYDHCGPNVSTCFVSHKDGHVEGGYNNLTSIRYDTKEKTVLLTSLGHLNEQCENSRMKTVIRFVCRNKTTDSSGPRLVRSSACENVIEWPSIRACPVSEVEVLAPSCKIHYEPLDIDIDIKAIVANRSIVEVPGIKIDGKEKKMILGLCQGIPRELYCGGKFISTTKACLVDMPQSKTTANNANNSVIVGSIINSKIKLADERIYLESFAYNKTCSEKVRDGFEDTRRVGTRIEFFCSIEQQDLPTFLGYDDCMYVFEWGSPLMCLESLKKAPIVPTPSGKTVMTEKTIEQFRHVNIKDVIKDDDRKREMLELEKNPNKADQSSSSHNPPRMNSFHKFFMISLIVMSFAAFIVIIFVLDKKTRLRVTLRQARQALQPNQQPYSRVVNDLDL